MICFRTMIGLCIVCLCGCQGRSATYTLYRNSAVGPEMRIHIATFNAVDNGIDYNRENCTIAADLFQGQRGVKAKYWCEKGDFRS